MFNSYVSLPEGTECECIRVNDYTMRFVVPNDPQMSNLLRSLPFGVFQRFSQPRILVHGIRRLMKAHRFQTLLDKTSPNCMGQITLWSNFIGIQRESPENHTCCRNVHLGTGMQYLTSSTCGPVFLERDWGCAWSSRWGFWKSWHIFGRSSMMWWSLGTQQEYDEPPILRFVYTNLWQIWAMVWSIGFTTWIINIVLLGTVLCVLALLDLGDGLCEHICHARWTKPVLWML